MQRPQEQSITITRDEARRGVRRQVSVPSAKGEQAMELRIPAGVQDGARIRIPNHRVEFVVNVEL